MPNRIHPRKNIKDRQPIDAAMDAVALISPLLGVPQVWQVYATRSAESLSLISWLGFAGVALVFLLYAIHHKIKPLIVAEVLWLSIYAAIIPAIIMFGTN